MDDGEERPSEAEGKWCRAGGRSTTEYRKRGHALERPATLRLYDQIRDSSLVRNGGTLKEKWRRK